MAPTSFYQGTKTGNHYKFSKTNAMNVKILLPFFSVIFPLAFSYILSMRDNIKPPVPGVTVTEDYAGVYIYYPIARSGNAYTVFLNRMSIAKLPNGGRLQCRLSEEKPLAITVIEGSRYIEPLTQSGNSRTITIKQGKSYYFRVTGSGSLEYIFDNNRGEKQFNESKDFLSQPLSFVETPSTSVPLLSGISNPLN